MALSICTFIAADCPLPEFEPFEEYPLYIDVDNGTIYDGDADDNYCLVHFNDVRCYADKKHGVILQWAYYTKGRAKQIIKIIKSALQYTDSVEIWRVWLGLNYDERPLIKTATVTITDLKPEDIQEVDHQNVWKKTPANSIIEERPTFYCLKVVH